MTPEPEMLRALPQEYTLFSALADELVSDDLFCDRIVKHSRAFVQWLLEKLDTLYFLMCILMSRITV